MVFFDLTNPTFSLIWSSLGGGLLAFLLKAGFDSWTDRTKARRDFASHVSQQIEKNATGYFLMANYARGLSLSLNRYVEQRSWLQLQPEDPESPFLMNQQEVLATSAAKESMFQIGFLYRVMTDTFWVKGGTYFLPDEWGSLGINNLHDNLLDLFDLHGDTLLKHINSTKTQQFQFYQKLDDSKDLHDEYVEYKEWLILEEKRVKDAAAYASAYSDLLRQQMDRLYRRKFSSDPRKAKDLKRPSYIRSEASQRPKPTSHLYEVIRDRIKPYSPLTDVTINLIIKSYQRERAITQEQIRLSVSEINAPAEKVTSDALLKLGWDYYVHGHYEVAASIYEDANNLEKTRELRERTKEEDRSEQIRRSVIYNRLGNVYATIAQTNTTSSDKEAFKNRAESNYNEALKLDPNNYAFHANLGLMYYNLGYFDKAIDYYTQATQTFARTTYNYEKLGDSGYYSRLAGYYNMIGNAWYGSEKKNCLTNAVKFYRNATALDPSDVTLSLNLAGAYREDRNYEAALEIYKKVVSLAPKRVIELAKSISENLEELDSKNAEAFYELAIKVYKDAIMSLADEPKSNKPNPNPAILHSAIGDIYRKLQQWTDAKCSYAKALEYDPMNSEYADDLVDAYQHLGEREENETSVYSIAIKNCQEAIKATPNNSNNHYILGLIYHRLEQYEESLNEHYKAIRLDPNNSDYYNQLGLTYRKLGRIDDAVRYYKKALSLNSKIDYCRNLGLGLQAFGWYDEAIPILENLLSENPRDLDVLLSLAAAYGYKQNSDPDKALDFLNRVKDSNPNTHQLYILDEFTGDFSRLKGSYSKAAEAYEKAYAYNCNSNDILEKLEDVYNKAINKEPDRGELYFGLGRTFERKENDAKDTGWKRRSKASIKEKKNYKMAIQKWEHAITAQTEMQGSALVFNNLGTAYDATNDIIKALECYKRAAILEPENFFVHYNMGSIYFREHDFQHALTEFQYASVLKSNHDQTFYNIGNCYYRMGRHIEFAKEAWQEAVGRNPWFAEAFYNLGVFYYEQGDKVMAKKSWQQAVTCDGSLLEAHYNLGIIHVDENNEEAAMEQLRIVQNYPRSSNLLLERPLDIKNLKLCNTKDILVLYVTDSLIN